SESFAGSLEPSPIGLEPMAPRWATVHLLSHEPLHITRHARDRSHALTIAGKETNPTSSRIAQQSRMQLVNNPRTSAAMECLRMVMEDKGAFADAVGAVTPWNMFGKPESLVTDNGCFKSKVFTNYCAELGITLERTMAGHPAMRGRVERFFRTAIKGVCSRLSGRTFANVLERGDHDAEKRTCAGAIPISARSRCSSMTAGTRSFLFTKPPMASVHSMASSHRNGS
ncbi:transposase, partial [Sinirhodobacter populi]